ncbi:hypothetical protein WA158_005606 [Blastocystis sp. Blastoise]
MASLPDQDMKKHEEKCIFCSKSGGSLHQCSGICHRSFHTQCVQERHLSTLLLSKPICIFCLYIKHKNLNYKLQEAKVNILNHLKSCSLESNVSLFEGLSELQFLTLTPKELRLLYFPSNKIISLGIYLLKHVPALPSLQTGPWTVYNAQLPPKKFILYSIPSNKKNIPKYKPRDTAKLSSYIHTIQKQAKSSYIKKNKDPILHKPFNSTPISMQSLYETYINSLTRTSYSSYGRFFTERQVLDEIRKDIQPYLKTTDLYIDMCSGNGDFPPLLGIPYFSFDIYCPRTNNALSVFRMKNWFDVKTLPSGCIIGLNPPFGAGSNNARQFLERAASFNPRLLIMIVPENLENLFNKTKFQLVSKNPQICQNHSFHIPGSSANNMNMNDYNFYTPHYIDTQTNPCLFIWANIEQQLPSSPDYPLFNGCKQFNNHRRSPHSQRKRSRKHHGDDKTVKRLKSNE